jgi:hypothetical protein
MLAAFVGVLRSLAPVCGADTGPWRIDCTKLCRDCAELVQSRATRRGRCRTCHFPTKNGRVPGRAVTTGPNTGWRFRLGASGQVLRTTILFSGAPASFCGTARFLRLHFRHRRHPTMDVSLAGVWTESASPPNMHTFQLCNRSGVVARPARQSTRPRDSESMAEACPRGRSGSRDRCELAVSQAHRLGRGSRGTSLLEGSDPLFFGDPPGPSFRTRRGRPASDADRILANHSV